MAYKVKRSPAEKQKREKQKKEKYEKIMEQFGSIEAYEQARQEFKSHKKSTTVEKPKIKIGEKKISNSKFYGYTTNKK
jgi:hypothetical protein